MRQSLRLAFKDSFKWILQHITHRARVNITETTQLTAKLCQIFSNPENMKKLWSSNNTRSAPTWRLMVMVLHQSALRNDHPGDGESCLWVQGLWDMFSRECGHCTPPHQLAGGHHSTWSCDQRTPALCSLVSVRAVDIKDVFLHHTLIILTSSPPL